MIVATFLDEGQIALRGPRDIAMKSCIGSTYIQGAGRAGHAVLRMHERCPNHVFHVLAPLYLGNGWFRAMHLQRSSRDGI